MDTTNNAPALNFNDALAAFVEMAQAKITAAYTGACVPPVLSVERGRRYARIVKSLDGKGGQRSVHCFVDLTNGDVLKAASWKTPAKHARGNIFAPDGGSSAVGAYGANYLR